MLYELITRRLIITGLSAFVICGSAGATAVQVFAYPQLPQTDVRVQNSFNQRVQVSIPGIQADIINGGTQFFPSDFAGMLPVANQGVTVHGTQVNVSNTLINGGYDNSFWQNKTMYKRYAKQPPLYKTPPADAGYQTYPPYRPSSSSSTSSSSSFSSSAPISRPPRNPPSPLPPRTPGRCGDKGPPSLLQNVDDDLLVCGPGWTFPGLWGGDCPISVCVLKMGTNDDILGFSDFRD